MCGMSSWCIMLKATEESVNLKLSWWITRIDVCISQGRQKQGSTVTARLWTPWLGTGHSSTLCSQPIAVGPAADSLLTSCWWRQESPGCTWCPSPSAGCHRLLHKDKTLLPRTPPKRPAQGTQATQLTPSWCFSAMAFSRHSKHHLRLTVLITEETYINKYSHFAKQRKKN